jgi:hypothetical protein
MGDFMHARHHRYLLASTVLLAFAPLAHAADYPYGSYAADGSYNPGMPYNAASAPTISYAPPAAAAPAYTPPAPSPYYQPAQTYTPVENPAPAAYAAPAYAPAAAPYNAYSQPPQNTRSAHYSLGVEGFYDRYREPAADVRVDSHAYYGSITGTGDWYNGPWDTGLDGRYSYGDNHYKSIDGTSDGIPQQDAEIRLREGYDIDYGQGRHFIPYLGLGANYFFDNGKGTSATDGTFGYDRRIWQFYVPVGLTYKLTSAYGFTYTPNIEFDPLLFGHVDSRLQNGGYENIDNIQHKGIGVRGSFMVGQLNSYGQGWEAGPFFRYWKVDNSQSTTNPLDGTLHEPNNNRLQAGLAAKYLF